MHVMNKRASDNREWWQKRNANSDKILRKFQMLYLINTKPNECCRLIRFSCSFQDDYFVFVLCSILSHIEFGAMNSVSLNLQTEIVTCIHSTAKSIIVSTEFEANTYFPLVYSNATKEEKIASSFLILSNLLCTSRKSRLASCVRVCVWVCVYECMCERTCFFSRSSFSCRSKQL